MGSARYEGGESHLRFIELPLVKGAKLHNYKVVNATFNEEIGTIHWRGGWMQYVFRALPNIDMSRSCHREIDKFIDELMVNWRIVGGFIGFALGLGWGRK
jgi:hypothetical protein